jgi:hypothetical protein
MNLDIRARDVVVAVEPNCAIRNGFGGLSVRSRDSDIIELMNMTFLLLVPNDLTEIRRTMCGRYRPIKLSTTYSIKIWFPLPILVPGLTRGLPNIVFLTHVFKLLLYNY